MKNIIFLIISFLFFSCLNENKIVLVSEEKPIEEVQVLNTNSLDFKKENEDFLESPQTSDRQSENCISSFSRMETLPEVRTIFFLDTDNVRSRPKIALEH